MVEIIESTGGYLQVVNHDLLKEIRDTGAVRINKKDIIPIRDGFNTAVLYMFENELSNKAHHLQHGEIILKRRRIGLFQRHRSEGNGLYSPETGIINLQNVKNPELYYFTLHESIHKHEVIHRGFMQEPEVRVGLGFDVDPSNFNGESFCLVLNEMVAEYTTRKAYDWAKEKFGFNYKNVEEYSQHISKFEELCFDIGQFWKKSPGRIPEFSLSNEISNTQNDDLFEIVARYFQERSFIKCEYGEVADMIRNSFGEEYLKELAIFHTENF